MPNKKTSIHSSQRGSVAVEFMLVFPIFMVVILLVIELSLMWVDRHIVKMAAYEAARSYLTEGVNDPCSKRELDPEKSAQEKRDRNAKRAAVLKVAAVSPSILFYASVLGLQIDTAPFTQTTQPLGAIGKAVGHLAVRLPTAMAMTRVSCQVAADGAITAEVTYWRAPRMPFVRNILWATYVLMKLNDALAAAGMDGLLRFHLDDLYFGVHSSSPALESVRGRFQDLRTQINGALDAASEMQLSFDQTAAILRSFPGFGQAADSYFGGATSQLNSAFTAARQGTNQALTQVEKPLNATIDAAQRAIDAQSSVVTALVYALPTELRLIPMKQVVRLAPARVDNSSGDYEGAQSFLVAPFQKQDSNFLGEAKTRWNRWVGGMVSTSDTYLVPMAE